MTEDFYFSIAKRSEGIYKEKGSKFLSFAFPIEDEKSVKALLAELKKDYYDARHICYAYILGAAKEIYRSNDDGEPHHTAGNPILNEIRSVGATDILVAVVRYFGGTKLGKSGLIQAYKESAADALKNATLIEKKIKELITVSFPYSATSEVMNVLNSLEAEILHQTFSEICTIKAGIRKSKIEEVKTRLERFLIHQP